MGAASIRRTGDVGPNLVCDALGVRPLAPARTSWGDPTRNRRSSRGRCGAASHTASWCRAPCTRGCEPEAMLGALRSGHGHEMFGVECPRHMQVVPVGGGAAPPPPGRVAMHPP